VYFVRFFFFFCRRKDKVDLEGDFEPSLLNSAVYLLQLIQEISTFAINYQGRPFRESIRENRSMYYGLLLVAGIAFACSTEFVPELNARLRLVPFTASFRAVLTALMLGDYAACWCIETVLRRAFSDFRPKPIALRRPDQLAAERRRQLEEQLQREDAERERDERELAEEAAKIARLTTNGAVSVGR
jgi:cation-transporting ATPase 13A1